MKVKRLPTISLSSFRLSGSLPMSTLSFWQLTYVCITIPFYLFILFYSPKWGATFPYHLRSAQNCDFNATVVGNFNVSFTSVIFRPPLGLRVSFLYSITQTLLINFVKPKIYANSLIYRYKNFGSGDSSKWFLFSMNTSIINLSWDYVFILQPPELPD